MSLFSEDAGSHDLVDKHAGKGRGRKVVYGTVPPMIKTLTNMQWHWTMKRDICDLLQDEYSADYKGFRSTAEVTPIESRKVVFILLAKRYLRYILSLAKFDECYKFMVHPQKRLLIVNCMEGIVARLLELKEEMVATESREFHFFDDLLQTLNLTPDQVALQVPEVFSEWRAKYFRTRELFLDTVLQKIKLQAEHKASGTDGSDSETDTESLSVSREAAILVIQRNQRGFMGRRKKLDMMKPYLDRMLLEKSRATGLKLHMIMASLKDKYIGKWRKFVQMRRSERSLIKEMVFLGMIPKPYQPIAAQASINEQLIRKKERAANHEDEYLNDRAILHERVLDTEGNRMGSDLRYNILQWLLETKDLMGNFPPFPEEDKGGSLLLFSNKTVAEVEEDIQLMFEGDTKKKPKEGDKEKEKEKKKKEKEKAKNEKGKKKVVADTTFSWTMPESNSLPVLKQVADTYSDFWYYRDEACNLEQRHDNALMNEEVRLEISEKIRAEVDETMRQELDRLTFGIEQIKKKPQKGKKKPDKKKDKKKKQPKDMTAGRTIEELYEELVVNDVIKKSEHHRIDDFIGAYSYVGCAMQDSGKMPMPSLLDVRQLITEQIIFPLISSVVHERAPLNRSFLIAGLRSAGKKMLINAICYESGANLFDLTPANLVGKYDSPEGKKMLMHLIMKVGKALEPSVFLIDDCDAIFPKKKIKGDEVKAFKWEKILRKTIKGIKNGDRMVLIGLTRSPFLAKAGKMSTCFARTILVPRPDYGNRRELWKHFITKCMGHSINNIFSDADISVLAMVSNGYPTGAIKQCCREVLSARRLDAIHRGFRLKTSEFATRLAAADPIYLDEEEAFLAWYASTPLAKKRLEFTAPDETGELAAAAAAAPGKKKGGKKK